MLSIVGLEGEGEGAGGQWSGTESEVGRVERARDMKWEEGGFGLNVVTVGNWPCLKACDR